MYIKRYASLIFTIENYFTHHQMIKCALEKHELLGQHFNEKNCTR